MNKLLSLFFLTILFSCNNSQKRKVLDKWDNGKNKVVLTYDNPNDTLTYLREAFYKSGKLFSKGHFLNGEQTGLWEWWYENGKKKDEAFLANGLYYKKRTHWYDNGKLLKEEFIDKPCTDNCCLGKVIFYNQDGTISQIRYNNPDSVTGIVYRYYPNGKPSEEHQVILLGDSAVEHGKLVQYFENGKIEVVGFLHYGCKDSVWRWNDSLGNLSQVDIWENCRLKERKKFPFRRVSVCGTLRIDRLTLC